MFDRAAVEARLAAGEYGVFDAEQWCEQDKPDQTWNGVIRRPDGTTLAVLHPEAPEDHTFGRDGGGIVPELNALLSDLRTTLAELDAATARVAALEAQVREDHAQGDTCCDVCCPYCEIDHAFPQHTGWPCAVLTTLALAPAPGEENG